MNFDTQTKIQIAQSEFNIHLSSEQMRNISFGSAGYLSKGSRKKLERWREKLGSAAGKSVAAEFARAVVEKVPVEAHIAQHKFLILATPVEQQDAENVRLLESHPSLLTAGDIATLARKIIAKFDKRMAKAIPVVVSIGNREIELIPR